MNTAVLGIDTSAYTASVALYDGRRVVREARRVVPVPLGRRGARPSDVVFHHVRVLPGLVDEVWQGEGIRAVAVSDRPCPRPDSYLPPFVAGVATAEALARGAAVPCVRTSHQEGHMAAGRLDAKGPNAPHFWALHVSGGTTELLSVARRAPGSFSIERVGGTSDLYAGQLVDRIGVELGLPFPAGPALEALSLAARDRVILPVGPPMRSPSGWVISFSGPEAAARRAIALGADPAGVARGVEEVLARALAKLVAAATDGHAAPLLLVGGVAANLRLRKLLAARLTGAYPLYCASPEHSRDNAVGVAVIGFERTE